MPINVGSLSRQTFLWYGSQTASSSSVSCYKSLRMQFSGPPKEPSEEAQQSVFEQVLWVILMKVSMRTTTLGSVLGRGEIWSLPHLVGEGRGEREEGEENTEEPCLIF